MIATHWQPSYTPPPVVLVPIEKHFRSVEENILRFLTKFPGATVKELADFCCITRPQVYAQLRKLEKHKKLEREQKLTKNAAGHYHIATWRIKHDEL